MLVLWCQAAVTAGSPTRSGTVDVDRGTLYYEIAGTGATALVFIHGGFGDRRMWDGQFEQFARDYTVVRYDHRGFGKSSPPDTLYSAADDLVALLDRLDLEQVVLVGNSMGGTLAIDFALLHPERVSGLVVVASGPGGIKMPQKDRDEMVKVFVAGEEEGVETAAEMWLAHPMVVVTSRAPTTRTALRTMVTENESIFVMQYWPSEAMDPPASQRLGEIAAPSLVVFGNRDTPYAQSLAEMAAKGIPKAQRVVIEGADHLPQMIAPDEFNRVLASFLRAGTQPAR